MTHVVIIAVRDSNSRDELVSGCMKGPAKIQFIQHLVIWAMVTLVVHGTDLGRVNATRQGMTAGSRRAMIIRLKVLHPAGFFPFAPLVGFQIQGLPHPLVKWAVVAVIVIVTEAEIDNPGFHPDTFFFQYLESYDPLLLHFGAISFTLFHS
jgi:hypothetical protein